MNWLSQEIVKALGLTLMDALWQGAVLLVFALLFVSFFRRISSRTKYRVMVALMLIMPIWSFISFDGHYQPHLPADLGFYDLRLEEARIAQENLARANGIFGFCYYHYWFNGKRILETPLERKLKNIKEDFPFMLCWANENWTRVWDGGEKNILLEQKYSHEDDLLHIRELIRYFKDDRYIKSNGKPVFVIYRPNLFPDIKKTIAK